jgi:RHS repeat-associated protein
VLDQRLYVQQDANWNVTALIDTSGNVVERYVYDPYGAVTVLTPSWGARAASLYNWLYLHQGGRYDPATGLYNFRHRDYSPLLMRWLQSDPLSFAAGDPNLYRDEGNNPVKSTDPTGLIDWAYWADWGLLVTAPGTYLAWQVAKPLFKPKPAPPAPAPWGSPPGLPPKGTPQEIEAGEAWLAQAQKELRFRGLKCKVCGPPGKGGNNDWNCAGLVEGAVSASGWSRPTGPGGPQSSSGILPLPLGGIKPEQLDSALDTLGGFKPVKGNNLEFEAGQQKIVVLGQKEGGECTPRHYALQLPTGQWISKLGSEGPPILHDDFDALIVAYGGILGVYSKPNSAYQKK